MAPTLTSFKKKTLELASRSKHGFIRVEKGIPRAALVTASAIFSYWLAEVILGHPYPVFAATVCIVSLGFFTGPRLPVVLDIVFGCVLGISIADVLVIFFGHGIWQAAVVVFVGLLLARFVNGSRTFSTQIAVQSLILVLFPLPNTGHFSRAFDALLGGIVAIVVTTITATNPQKYAGKEIDDVLKEIKKLVEANIKAIEKNDYELAYKNLMWARGTQDMTENMMSSVEAAQETVRVAPQYRGYGDTLDEFEKIATHADLAVRNCRTISRLVMRALEPAEQEEFYEERKRLIPPLEKLTHSIPCIEIGVKRVGKIDEGELEETTVFEDIEAEETMTGETDNVGLASFEDAQVILEQGAELLGEEFLYLHSPESYAILLIVRELYVDLLRTTGLNAHDAVAVLPPLELPHDNSRK